MNGGGRRMNKEGPVKSELIRVININTSSKVQNTVKKGPLCPTLPFTRHKNKCYVLTITVLPPLIPGHV